MTELVSIIVSVYNIETYLPKCLESISRQTYQDLDIILIDDGSTDSSGLICDEFAVKDSRARVIHQENHGLWAVRNLGQKEAYGEYLLFVDGDDYFHDDYVRLLYEAINKDGHQYPMAVCGYTRVRGDEFDVTSLEKTVFTVRNRHQLIEGFFDGSIYWSLSSNWDKMYRKSYLDIPFQREYPRCQDMDSNLRALFSKIDHAIFISNVLYFYRIREGQLTKTKDYPSIMNNCISSIYYSNYTCVPESLKQYKPLLLKALYQRLAIWKMSIDDDYIANDFPLIASYEKKTISDILLCKGIPMKFKIRKLIKIHLFSSFNRIIRHKKRISLL